MKIQTCDIEDIQFQYTNYPQTLKESILRMGQGFAIHVKQVEHSYICLDGHKRLSAISDILRHDPNHQVRHVKILVMNSARTSSGTAKNHH